MDEPHHITGVKGKTSVWLSSKIGSTLKKYHCHVCGKVAFEYYNDVHIILAGDGTTEEQIVEAPVVIQCQGTLTVQLPNGGHVTKNCKQKFYIR